MTTPIAGAKRRVPIAAYFQPRVRIMTALGFASGLPFLLVGNTFGFWLRDEHTSLAAIGFLSWVGIAYSLQFLWAPLIDRVRVLRKLGLRRGWLLASQISVALGLFAMAYVGTRFGLGVLGACALWVAFSAATQDIALAAWRIEIAANPDELGLLTAANTFGYRVAMICTDALILISAQHLGWPISYTLCGLAMAIGLIATLMAGEPVRGDKVAEEIEKERPIWTVRGMADAIAGPFIVFFKTHGAAALLMLLAISLYRLPDFLRGPMVNPFFHDIGMSKDFVGLARSTVGLGTTFLGMIAGGFFSMRFGYMRALILGGILQAIGIASQALIAQVGASPFMFLFVMGVDDFSISVAGITLVAYMSSLTSLGYTATQYALLSSTYALAGKFLKGFSGSIIESLSGPLGLMNAYAVFFVGAGLIGIPSILLFLALGMRLKKANATTTS